jgi:hypothetical protein
VADPRHARGLIDTSVVIDLELIDPADLPGEIAVSAITMAELSAGPHATNDPAERARRQDRLQRAEATFEPLPVDTRQWLVRTAVSTRPSARQAAKRAAGARWICSLRPLQWRRACPCTRAIRTISPGLSQILDVVTV